MARVLGPFKSHTVQEATLGEGTSYEVLELHWKKKLPVVKFHGGCRRYREEHSKWWQQMYKVCRQREHVTADKIATRTAFGL